MQIIKSFNPNSSFKNSHKRKNGWSKTISVMADYDGELQQLAEVRVYETANRTYACVWLFFGEWPSASAVTSGYGFDRDTFAVVDALEKVGVEFAQDIRGRGDYGISNALVELCENQLRKATKCKAFIYHA